MYLAPGFKSIIGKQSSVAMLPILKKFRKAR